MPKCLPIRIGGATIEQYNETDPYVYIGSLQAMDDWKLFDTCKDMIWFSAYALNRPSSDFHWMCDACFAECKRRGRDDIYQKAYEVNIRSV
jgi:hypothetical protein